MAPDRGASGATSPTASQIKQKARELGFSLAGVAPIEPTPELDYYPEWIDRGYAGKMSYLERQTPDRLDPTRLVEGAKSVVVCAVNYETDRPRTRFDRARAWVSRYAWGEDYHDVVGQRLHDLADWIRDESHGAARAYVDTGPLVERVYARYAGVGWFGKNTCIINQGIGSWLFLGCILTDLDLAVDQPPPDRCGSCTRCLDACPTDAFVAPYVLDSRRCISYLNIELRGSIPEELREGMGHHLFGCDICQDVCPWNRRAPAGGEPRFEAREALYWPELDTLLDWNDDDWRRALKGTSMKRAKVRGLVRNLMVVAGNSGLARLAGKVRRFLDYPDADVRSHAHWALGRLDSAHSSERGSERPGFDPPAPTAAPR